MLEKAAGIEADEIVFDLEDAVAPAAKDEAVVARLADWEGATAAVRVNAPRTPWCHRDLVALAAVPAERLRSVVVPKVESAGDLDFVGRLLARAEAAASGREKAADPGSWLVAQDRLLGAARANGLQAIDGPFLGVKPDELFPAAATAATRSGSPPRS